VADRPATGPDRTKRSLRPRPITFGLVAVGLLAGTVGIATRGAPQTILALAILAVVVFDAISARAALAPVRPTIANPVDAVVGRPIPYVIEAPDLTRPVLLVRPAQWPVSPRQTLALNAPDPGGMTLASPPRGVVTNLVFDLVAVGPLGLWDAACRVRIWFPVPLAVAPAPLAHDPDWPALRTLPVGETATVARGDDLFRGVRPYVRGDARRSVHWPATAHHGTLMVKERDGLEQVAIRIVVHLPVPDLAADLAAARAAWLVEQSLARGWLVHLVTVEAQVELVAPPPLLRPRGPLPLPFPFPVMAPTRTVEQRIGHIGQARGQLARAAAGWPAMERSWKGLTRVVSPTGDRWQ